LGYFLIGGDAAAAIYFASAVGGFQVVLVLGVGMMRIVIVEERLMRVIALDETAAGSEVVGDGEQQGGALVERNCCWTRPLPKVVSPSTQARS